MRRKAWTRYCRERTSPPARDVRMPCRLWNIPELNALRARCPSGHKQDWRRTRSDRRHGREPRRAGESDKAKHQEGNLGQTDARTEKDKQSELSNMGESSRDASHNRKEE